MLVRNDSRGPAATHSKTQARNETLSRFQVSQPLLFQPVRQQRRRAARRVLNQPLSQILLPDHAKTLRPKLEKTSLARVSPLAVRR
jgi:hypothetical protein